MTEALIAEKLRSVGIEEVRTGVGGHGVTALIRGALPGKCLAIRADCDALPILEETGLVGGIFVIGLYTCILWRGYEIFKKAPDLFGKTLSAGITLWIFMEAALNICVMLNIMPFAGNALPLVSLGGSSMACTMVALGILLNISRVSAIENSRKGKNEPDAIIDMRGGDWGWRVSRSGSSSDRDK